MSFTAQKDAEDEKVNKIILINLSHLKKIPVIFNKYNKFLECPLRSNNLINQGK